MAKDLYRLLSILLVLSDDKPKGIWTEICSNDHEQALQSNAQSARTSRLETGPKWGKKSNVVALSHSLSTSKHTMGLIFCIWLVGLTRSEYKSTKVVEGPLLTHTCQDVKWKY